MMHIATDELVCLFTVPPHCLLFGVRFRDILLHCCAHPEERLLCACLQIGLLFRKFAPSPLPDESSVA